MTVILTTQNIGGMSVQFLQRLCGDGHVLRDNGRPARKILCSIQKPYPQTAPFKNLQFLSKCREPIGDSGSRVVSGTILQEKRLASAAVIIRKQRCPLTRFLVAEPTKSGQKLCKKTLPVTRNFGTMRMKKCRLLVRVPPRGDIL